MSSDTSLLEYYRRELDYINDRAAQFARRHPKVAGRLGLSAGGTEDPHVERLIQAFAFLGAGTHLKLDEDLPEITTGLLEILYPHYARPIPSTAIVQFHFDRAQAERREPHLVSPGARLRSQRVRGVACEYRSCYPVTLWPIEVANASLDIVSEVEGGRPGRSYLDIRLRTMAEPGRFAALNGFDRVRFYLHDESPHNSLALYELMLRASSVLASDAAGGPEGTCRIAPVGFARDQSLFPSVAQAPPGHALLLEYFAFPQKFLFLDIDLPAEIVGGADRELRLRFVLESAPRPLVSAVSRDSFRLGCTPIVNLFEHRKPPASIRVKHLQRDYQVIPDATEYYAQEVYSVDRVTGVHDGHPLSQEIEYVPLYALKHGRALDRQRTFWHAVRRENLDEGVGGGDVFLTLVDLDHQPALKPRTTLAVETTCLNRGLPSALGVKPGFTLMQRGLVSMVECVRAPTPTRRPFTSAQSRWRLLAHLALNHRALIADDGSPEAFRELLTLYDIDGSAAARESIQALKEVRRERGVARVPRRGADAFSVGMDIALVYARGGLSDHGRYLFASVIERFLSATCPINAFTRVSAWEKGGDQPFERWPARSGGREWL